MKASDCLFLTKRKRHFPVPVTKLIQVVLAFVFTANIGILPLSLVQGKELNQVKLRQFNLVTDTSGWVLLDQYLYWTFDAGNTWEEIGPSIPPDGLIQDIAFIDSDTGWVLWTLTNSDDRASFQLAHTINHGNTWITSSLSLFEPSDITAEIEEAQMDWLDPQIGWISTKQKSGSNFSVGFLFTTSDGGHSWSRSALPVADSVYFGDPQIGWAIGGPTGSQIFNTQNAGISWEDSRPADLRDDIQAIVYPPLVSGGKGLLAMTTLGAENDLRIYSLNQFSDKWLPIGQIKLDVQPGLIGLSILDAQSFVATIPGTKSIFRMVNGELEILENMDGVSASIVELDMVALDIGWAKSIDSSCVTDSLSDRENSSISCSSSTRLLRTTDGGITWQNITLPSIYSNSATLNFAENSNTLGAILPAENTQIFTGQGFDRCEIPTLSQMQTWADSSPYKTVNLYIGGSSRACANNALISSYLFLLYQQGWKFIPTWVGPQAPCTGYTSRMSSDPITAHEQGVNQANLAVERLAELGLTTPNKAGSVIYYDIEHYGTDVACRSAINAFMNGWVSQIHSLGNIAGVYGSTLCSTGLSDFLNITNMPDVVWPARWYHNLGSGYYDPTATVWNLGNCIPNTAWSNHQRIRQYEGDHDETWGGLILDIDSNVLDGVVAIPYDYPFVSNILRTDITPTNTATVGFTVIFSKSVTGVNNADFVLSTSGVTGPSISAISGSGSTYTVTLNTGVGDGTIRLDVVDNESIRDGSNNPLGGLGTGNGNYTSSATYTINKSSTFADVPSNYWSRDYIESLYNAGVTTGCNISPLLYCPGAEVTRDQMAVFLLRGKYTSSYVPPTASGVFADVPTDHWAADWIEALAAEGITTGCSVSPKLYCPGTPVTRDQMAVFLLRAKYGSSYVPPRATGVFADVPTDHWAADWIEALAAEGITTGCSVSPKLYCPAAPVTRDQMAVFLVRTFNLP